MRKSTRTTASVKNNEPEGLFDVLGYKQSKLVRVISPEPLDFAGAVAMAAGYNDKPSPITAVVVPVAKQDQTMPVASDDARIKASMASVNAAFKVQLAVINEHADDILTGEAIGIVAASLQRAVWLVTDREYFDQGFDLEATSDYASRLEDLMGISEWANSLRERDTRVSVDALVDNFGKEFERWISRACRAVTTPFEAVLLARAIKVHAIACVHQSTGMDDYQIEQTFEEILDGDIVSHNEQLNALFGLDDKMDSPKEIEAANVA